MRMRALIRTFPLVGAVGLLSALMGLGLFSPSQSGAADLADELKQVPFKIVYESYQDDNWELMMVNADGSQPVNLTRTPKVDELYPARVAGRHARSLSSSMAKRRGKKVRSVYVMNLDGTGRTLVAGNAREPCWDPAGTGIIYLKGESDQFTLTDFATRGICRFDLADPQPQGTPQSGHPSPLQHLLHAGRQVVRGHGSCRAWATATRSWRSRPRGSRSSTCTFPGAGPTSAPTASGSPGAPTTSRSRVGELDFSGPEPKVVRARDVVKSEEPMEMYHVDWSPDGKYLAFSRGPKAKRLGPAPEMIGVVAEGWDICVADASATNRWVAITTDGKANKEPDWVPVGKKP